MLQLPKKQVSAYFRKVIAMSNNRENRSEDLILRTEQLVKLLAQDRQVTKSKNIRRLQKKQYKRLIHKAGFQSLMPRFNKTPKFWKVLAIPMVKYRFLQGDFEMPPYILHEMEHFFTILHTHYPIVKVNGTLYSIFEIDTLQFPFTMAVQGQFSKESKVYKTTEAFIDGLEIDEVQESYYKGLRMLIGMVTRHYSSLNSWLYVAEFDCGQIKGNKSFGMEYVFTINRKKPEKFKSKGVTSRTYLKMEIPSVFLYNFIPLMATYEGRSYPVYLQQHALERIHERVDVPLKHVTNVLISQVSYKDVRTYKGNILVPLYSNPYRVYRIGYLLGAIKDGKLLINTFLFISQDGTPEGDKLNELLEINKVEKHFLELDRVEHFVNSSLKDDKELYPIFETCNLSHLFVLYYNEKEKPQYTDNATFIKQTLQLDTHAVQENLTSVENLKKEFQPC